MKTQKNELYLLIFLMGTALFNWPLLKIANGSDIWGQFIYLFLTWCALISLSLLISRFIKDVSVTPEKDSTAVSEKKEN